MFRDANAFLNYVGTKFLNWKCADIAHELADNTITKPVVVQVQNVLHDLDTPLDASGG